MPSVCLQLARTAATAAGAERASLLLMPTIMRFGVHSVHCLWFEEEGLAANRNGGFYNYKRGAAYGIKTKLFVAATQAKLRGIAMWAGTLWRRSRGSYSAREGQSAGGHLPRSGEADRSRIHLSRPYR